MVFSASLQRALVFSWCVAGVLGGGEAASHGAASSLVAKSSEPQVTTSASSITSADRATITTTTLSTGTCASGTVNYITHTLPQQCLRKDRTAATAHNDSIETSKSSSTSDATATPAITVTESTVTSTQVVTVSGSSLESVEPSTQTTTTSSEAADSLSVPSATTVTQTVPSPQLEDESDSPLDNAHFLSFEEWKVQNLAKVGQSPENIGKSQTPSGNRHRPDLINALDSLGDENEIDLDFTGFVGGAGSRAPSEQLPKSDVHQDGVPVDQQAPASPVLRSKDAGKTCKERTNYASFDCAATALKSNKECKSSSSILVENKDSYMLNICSAQNKFIIVELCDDILIDTIVLANYEFFSSSFRHFRVSVSDRYPVKLEKWKDLGTFEARNTREIQAFLVENPLIWARYLRIEFLTHYGSEYYCPVSLLRVHGTTMLEEFRHQEDIARGEDEDALSSGEPAATVIESSDLPPQNVENAADPHIKPVIIEPFLDNPSEKASDLRGEDKPAASDSLMPTSSPVAGPPSVGKDGTAIGTSTSDVAESSREATSDTTPVIKSPIEGESAGGNVSVVSTAQASSDPLSTQSASSALKNGTSVTSEDESRSTSSTAQKSQQQQSKPSETASASSQVASNQPMNSTSTTTNSSKAAEQAATSTSGTPPQSASSASSSSPPSQPPTQESFFKSVHKRLQQLESNSTLSLKYIEEQSRILRDAFSKVEKRQISMTTNFLTNLNQTVMTELHGFRQAYDQLWQSTVIELEGQRQQNQREMLALSARLTMVADELVWQKRMGILQSTLLLLCLALVLFGRGSSGQIASLEMPFMQQMMNRSATALRLGLESPPASPSPDSRSPVSLFRRKIWRASPSPADGVPTSAGNQTDSDREGLEVRLEPPTPPHDHTHHLHRCHDSISEDGIIPDADNDDDDNEDEEEQYEERESSSASEKDIGPPSPESLAYDDHVDIHDRTPVARRPSTFSDHDARITSPLAAASAPVVAPSV